MMKRLITSPALSLALAVLPVVATAGQTRAAEPGVMELTFEVEQRTGAVMVAVFDSQQNYEKNVPAQATRVEVGAGPVKAVFHGLKPGAYAAKAFHDRNDDGAMNVNTFDMPTEPFAFSNNAPARFGPAAWTAAAFDLGPDGAAQTITLR